MPRSIVVALCFWCTSSLFAMNHDHQQVRLVFMGRTGVGKTTLVTAFYNFALDVAWDAYPKQFPAPTSFQACNVEKYRHRCAEDHARGQLDAVTQIASEYEAASEKFSVSLIDCAGVADPRGVEKDREIVAETARFLGSAGPVNARCIVLPGNLSRATIEEKYAIEEIKSLIPNDDVGRVFIIVTHTSVVTENIRQFVNAAGLPTKNIFAFDNLALSEDGYGDFSGVSLDNCDGNGDGTQMLGHDVRRAWNASKHEFIRLLAVACELGSSSYPFRFGRIGTFIDENAQDMHTWFKGMDALDQYPAAISSAKMAMSMAEKEWESASDAALVAAREYDAERDALSKACMMPTPQITLAEINARLFVVTTQVERTDRRYKEQSAALESRRESYYAISERARTCEEDQEILIGEIAHRYLQMSDFALSSINPHIVEYYDACIRSEQSSTRRARLETERRLMLLLLEKCTK